MISEDLFPFYRLILCLDIMSFAIQKLLSFRRSHLLIVSLNVCAAEAVFEKCQCILVYF